jgi:transcriptional antiterminator RfaH
MSYWTVVQCRSQCEHIVRLLLMRGNFETYLPRIKHRNRIAPLFPAYLFVRVVEQFYPIMSTPHVVRVLMSGDRPVPMPENAMAELFRRQGRDGFVKLAQRRGPMIGSRVRVLAGQFAGQIGVYNGQSAKERERVLLNFLGRSVRVELGQGDRIEAFAQDVVANQ